MLKCVITMLLPLCILCGAAMAVEPVDKHSAKERKTLEKTQKKQIRKEARRFEQLRNDAVMQFAKQNPPTDIITPLSFNDFRITNVICAGDIISGTVMLYFDITPLFGQFRLFMGGERNGTYAVANGVPYPSADHYGRVYTLRGGQPQQVLLLFYNLAPDVKQLDRVDVSMGLALNTLNRIILRNVPIFWTYSNNVIKNYVNEETSKKVQ